ncbi:hypothetical protein ACTXJX_16100 [Glutamicibacter ardleyensis]|uniref:hypothetical protein n=1 Tax=Glutamicibacter ardleyensis TaxID=225894 RepID=UPI003FD53742
MSETEPVLELTPAPDMIVDIVKKWSMGLGHGPMKNAKIYSHSSESNQEAGTS